MDTAYDIETNGLAPTSNTPEDYILKKWRYYVENGLTFKSRDNFVRSDTLRVDEKNYTEEEIAAWRRCVLSFGYIGSLTDHAVTPCSTGCPVWNDHTSAD